MWRRSELAIVLVLVVAGAIACSDRTATEQKPEPIGAGAGGAHHEPDEATPPSSGGTGGAMAGEDASVTPVEDSGAPPPIDAAIDAATIDADVIEPIDESCLANLADYKQTGPFTFEATSWKIETNTIRAFIPDVPAGCRVPVVHFANGTGATCMNYQSTLEHLASFGFVALCFESPNTGAGTQCIESVELAYDKLPDLVSNKVGLTGHHFGGMAALLCAYRAEEAWGAQRSLAAFALSPTHGSGGTGDVTWTEAYPLVETPILMVNTEGGLVSQGWVNDAFDYLPETTEAYQYEAVGASELPIPAEQMNEAIVAWLRWKLLADQAACAHFKAMPDTEAWELIEATSAIACE